jgi:hypothetical protein
VGTGRDLSLPAKASIRLGGLPIQHQVVRSASAPAGTTPPFRGRQQPHPLGQDLPGDHGGGPEDAGEECQADLAGMKVDAGADDASRGEGDSTALQRSKDLVKIPLIFTAQCGHYYWPPHRWGYGGAKGGAVELGVRPVYPSMAGSAGSGPSASARIRNWRLPIGAYVRTSREGTSCGPQKDQLRSLHSEQKVERSTITGTLTSQNG